MRPLISLLLCSWDPLSQPVWTPIPLDRETHARIHWWLMCKSTLVGALFPREPYSHIVFTHMCLTGWVWGSSETSLSPQFGQKMNDLGT